MKFFNPIAFLKSRKYLTQGIWLLVSSKYSESISYFEKSLNCSQGNKKLIFVLNKYLGMAYWNDNQHQKGKQYLLEAEKITNIEQKKIDFDLFGYLGLVYDTEGDFKNAKKYYQLAVKHYEKSDFMKLDFIHSRLIKIDK